MTEEARAARNLYKRNWRRKNREKVQAQQERYWEKKGKEAEATATSDQETDTPAG